MKITMVLALFFQATLFAAEKTPAPPSPPSWQGTCKTWGPPQKTGEIPLGLLPEGSGLASASPRSLDPQRLYHINDGAKRPFLITTDRSGQKGHLLVLQNVAMLDPEDLAGGPCGDKEAKGESCLFIADVGDNDLIRKEVRIVVVKEPQVLPGKVQGEIPLLQDIRLHYPDGKPHNAESLGVHPVTGDLFLVTKTKKKKEPALLFRLARSRWESYKKGAAPLIMDFMGSLSLNIGPITGMSIAPDGRSFVLLTHKKIHEFHFDLSSGKNFQEFLDRRQEGGDYRTLAMAPLPQAEGIAYADDGKTWKIYYHSEYKGKEVPIFMMECPRWPARRSGQG